MVGGRPTRAAIVPPRMPPPRSCLEFEHLHQPEGWLSPGFVEVDATGTIARVSAVRPRDWPKDTATIRGFAIPGMPNVHSHAFQRAMAGFAEHRGHPTDTFWTWRETMYSFANALDPDTLEDLTAMAFLEMVKAGWTSVGEFHYIHRDPQGQAYADPAEMSWRVCAAAERVGLGLTLLPVLYLHGGFETELTPRQRRFAHTDVDDFLGVCARIHATLAENPLRRFGVAPHSLRAVTPNELRELIVGVDSFAPASPLHLHAAEQQREVSECVAHLGAGPVAYLLSRFPLGERWCIVHATHVDDGERLALARSDAIVGICPTTEANLGDGLFATGEYLAEGGGLGIGTDSNIEIDPCAELRALEYGQRLRHETRNVLVGPGEAGKHVGRNLWEITVTGGARALRQPVGMLVAGQRADIVVLDGDCDRMVGHARDTAIDAYVFSAGPPAVRDVFVAGRCVVENRRHAREDEIRASYRRAMRELRAKA